MNKKGFSLIEVMIGVAILAAMTLLIYTTMSRALDGKARVERRDELFHAVRVGLGKMTADLSQAFLANVAFAGRETQYASGFIGTDQRVDFSSLSHFHFQKNTRDTDQVSVGYYLEANESELFDLHRRESARLSEKITEGGNAYTLIENIKEFRMEYYDSNKKEWVTEWDSTQLSNLNRLPQAVKITIRILEAPTEEGEEGGREFFYSTMAPVNLYASEINF